MPLSVQRAAHRQLSRAQMAFVRCWAEGLDLSAAWERYLFLGGAADARRVRSELRRLLDMLCHLARAHGRPEVAALLRRDPQAIADRDARLPTLDEFRARQPSDFYSEAELSALYRDEFGAPDSRGTERRRQRLRERLVLALQWLERVGVRDPSRDDALADWLDERVAGRLAAAGLHTLAELLDRIALRGPRWYRGVPRVGPGSAARLERWLAEHEAALGALPSPPVARAATTQRQAGVVPIERYAPPADLDGLHGSNRAPAARCRIDAANDPDAVRAWLQRHESSSHTWRAYRREAERFLVWAALARSKALSSLDGDDCAAYRAFLAAPGADWTSPRNTPRVSTGWRPFEGPLSAGSVRTAVTILRALCGWLVRQRYLASNPWDDTPPHPEPPPAPPLRALSPAHWNHVDSWLAARPPSPAAQRLRFIVGFAYRTGLRLSELAAARLSWLQHDPTVSGSPAWSIRVPHGRGRWRDVPLTDGAVAALRRALAERRLEPEPLANDARTPLVARLAGESPLSAARIHQVLVQAFARCAGDIAPHDGAAADRIRQVTMHWLRHTHGAHAAARGVPQDVLGASLGHRSLASTAIYTSAEQERRRAMKAAFGEPEGFREA